MKRLSLTAGVILLLVLWLMIPVIQAQAPIAPGAAVDQLPKDLSQELADARSRAAKLEAISMYKDFQLAQKDFDVLYQAFLGQDQVKVVSARMQNLRDMLIDLESKMLEAAGKKRGEWFVDFATGEIKPVEKKATAPAAPAPTPSPK